MLATLLAVGLALGLPVADELHVSSRTGDDATADGTRARPFRSITAAIAAADPGRGADIRVDLGTYDAEGGERFPLRLSPGLRIRGLGSGATTIDGGEAPVVLDGGAAAGMVVLGGLSVTGRGTGLRLGAPAEGERELALRDVAVRGLTAGLAVELARDPEAGRLTLRAHGLRAADCERGVAVHGSSPIVITLEESVFERCGIGLFLEADPAEDPSRIGQEDAPEFARVCHDLTVTRTRFLGCRTAGVRRQGADGKNAGPPYVFTDCVFRSNDIGLELLRPCADTGFLVSGTEFLENTRFGLHVTGLAGEPERFSRVEDALFRWNGVGLHATSTNLEVQRTRIIENLGNGVFSSNFLAAPTVTSITDSLLADNGGSGFYGLADARLLTVHFVHSTIANNGYAGVYDKTRHAGTSQYEVRGCIVAGNAEDLHGVDGSGVLESWIGDDSEGGDDGGLRGDPGFVAPELGDYRLRADSPCLDRGSDEGAYRAGLFDLDGRERRRGIIDLGAYERS